MFYYSVVYIGVFVGFKLLVDILDYLIRYKMERGKKNELRLRVL